MPGCVPIRAQVGQVEGHLSTPDMRAALETPTSTASNMSFSLDSYSSTVKEWPRLAAKEQVSSLLCREENWLLTSASLFTRARKESTELVLLLVSATMASNLGN